MEGGKPQEVTEARKKKRRKEEKVRVSWDENLVLFASLSSY